MPVGVEICAAVVFVQPAPTKIALVNSNGNAYVTYGTASPDFPQVQSLQTFKGDTDKAKALANAYKATPGADPLKAEQVIAESDRIIALGERKKHDEKAMACMEKAAEKQILKAPEPEVRAEAVRLLRVPTALALKGRAEAVAAHRLLALDEEADAAPSPFVGRVEELQVLRGLAGLLTEYRRDWVPALLAETNDLPSPAARLAWLGGGKLQCAPWLLIVYPLARYSLYAALAMLMVTVIYNDLTRISWIERLMPWR